MLAPCAQAKNIQMLPPVDFNGIACDSPNSKGGGLLYWDGSNPIRCIPESSGDANGTISATGATVNGPTNLEGTVTISSLLAECPAGGTVTISAQGQLGCTTASGGGGDNVCPANLFPSFINGAVRCVPYVGQ
jgi:hypothetical protein